MVTSKRTPQLPLHLQVAGGNKEIGVVGEEERAGGEEGDWPHHSPIKVPEGEPEAHLDLGHQQPVA